MIIPCITTTDAPSPTPASKTSGYIQFNNSLNPLYFDNSLLLSTPNTNERGPQPRSRNPSRSRASARHRNSSKSTSRVGSRASSRVRGRSHHANNKADSKENGSCLGLSLSLEDEWWQETSFIESPATEDHIGKLVRSIEKIERDLGSVDSIDLETDCYALQTALNRLIISINMYYTNENWLESSPPPSLNQTLRRLKNWIKSVRPTSQPLTFTSSPSPFGLATTLESPTKAVSDCNTSRLRSFTNKFENIIRTIEDEEGSPDVDARSLGHLLLMN